MSRVRPVASSGQPGRPAGRRRPPQHRQRGAAAGRCRRPGRRRSPRHGPAPGRRRRARRRPSARPRARRCRRRAESGQARDERHDQRGDQGPASTLHAEPRSAACAPSRWRLRGGAAHAGDPGRPAAAPSSRCRAAPGPRLDRRERRSARARLAPRRRRRLDQGGVVAAQPDRADHGEAQQQRAWPRRRAARTGGPTARRAADWSRSTSSGAVSASWGCRCGPAYLHVGAAVEVAGRPRAGVPRSRSNGATQPYARWNTASDSSCSTRATPSASSERCVAPGPEPAGEQVRVDPLGPPDDDQAEAGGSTGVPSPTTTTSQRCGVHSAGARPEVIRTALARSSVPARTKVAAGGVGDRRKSTCARGGVARQPAQLGAYRPVGGGQVGHRQLDARPADLRLRWPGSSWAMPCPTRRAGQHGGAALREDRQDGGGGDPEHDQQPAHRPVPQPGQRKAGRSSARLPPNQ